ncbi:MAG: hypothetical protein FJY11_04065 [Bacteroidetes bacterium]|nr:hypothetical protein [Bacteroidota bacterium]
MRTIVFLGSAMLMLGLLITDVYSAWYEWTKEAREKLEWNANIKPCSKTVQLEAVYSPELGISLIEFQMALEMKLQYIVVYGERISCIDGTTYKDCKEIVGSWWDSWDGEGDCIPGGIKSSNAAE